MPDFEQITMAVALATLNVSLEKDPSVVLLDPESKRNKGAAAAFNSLVKAMSDEGVFSPFLSQYDQLQKHHRILAEKEKEHNFLQAAQPVCSMCIMIIGEPQPMKHQQMPTASPVQFERPDTNALAYRITVPPPMDDKSTTAYGLVSSGNQLMCAAMDTTTKIAPMLDVVQFGHLVKLYDKVEQQEKIMWLTGEPSEDNAQKYFWDACVFLTRAQLITCLLKVPADDIRRQAIEVHESKRDFVQ
ncbi:hypothetical protein C8R43DRAFT_1008057 [Mycena crocata]|nr:hypothetical protein C8R43DRAFT_1008057 [Mycena crocata]